MLVIISILLVIAWILGIFGIYSIGSYVNIFLALAIFILFMRLIQGKNPID